MHGLLKNWAGRGAKPEAKALHERIETVDLLRGLVIVLMVLDHVRDYFHEHAYLISAVDPDRSYPALFATRWITHLCAPIFVALAGVSAQLQLQAGKPMRDVRRLLWTRGLWLILLEATLVGFGFNMGPPILFLQVIWAIGWSMIALAVIVSLPAGIVAAIGAAILLGHNLLDPVTPAAFGDWGVVWQFLHEGGPILVAGQPLGAFAYPALPWFGVMFLGFAAGRVFLLDAEQRQGLFFPTGLALFGTFVLIRAQNGFGDPEPWVAREYTAGSVMAFLNVEKYPPSLLYVLATLGVGLMLVPLLERLPRIGAGFLLAFGRVPLFAYLTHIYVVHGLMLLVLLASGRDVSLGFGFLVRIFMAPQSLAGWGYSLPVVFAIWALVLALLYPLCRWYAGVKRRRRDWWLSYL
jgi:uncharacterized membrane protein